MSLLDLPGWNLIERVNEGKDLVLRAEFTQAPKACPHCGCVANLYRHGALEQDFIDTPMHGKRCTVRVDRKRYRCRDCSRTFMEPLTGLDDSHRMTERLADYIRRQAMDRTYTSLAVELGVDEKTIRNVFNTYAEELREQFTTETPVYLGIDEIHVIGQARAIFTNVLERTIVDLLEKRDQKTIINYLSRMPDRDRVELVAIDMWTPYREAARICLPQAQVVIDKYHVVRMASDCLEKVRKATHADLTPAQRRTLKHDRFALLKRKRNLTDRDWLKLESWTGSFPDLLAAYEAKEAFYELFDSNLSSGEAKREYHEWLRGLSEKTKAAFDPLIGALERWEEPVFAYFDHRITNAYTEAMNGVARVINRMGRGYSFAALRVKLLFRSPRKKSNTAYSISDTLASIPGVQVVRSIADVDFSKRPGLIIPDAGVDMITLFEEFVETGKDDVLFYSHEPDPLPGDSTKKSG